MTAMQKLIEFLDPIHYAINYRAKELMIEEREQLFNAMMYALDEDGHTGEWKIKFVNDYINNLYKK